MIILPAIDILNGKCVRLTRGNFQDSRVYSVSPLEVAAELKSLGATWLHLVDLDGARRGSSSNGQLIQEIVSSTGLKIELGGGIRTREVIEEWLQLGIERVILGTTAVQNPDFVVDAVQTFGADRVAVGLDFKDQKLAIKGWLQNVAINWKKLVEKYVEANVTNFVVTDTGRDGMLEGLNWRLIEEFLKLLKPDNLVASGGVSSLSDLSRAQELGLQGIVVGKAWYEGKVDLGEAFRLYGQEEK